MKRRRGSIAWWLVFLLAVFYFVLPLYATLAFSLKAKPAFSAYTNALSDPQFFLTLGYSFVVGIATIIGSLALIVPTAYWVQLRVPRARSAVEFVTLQVDHLARQAAVLVDPAAHRSRVDAPQRLRAERAGYGPTVAVGHPGGVEAEARALRGADALARDQAQHQGASGQAISVDDNAFT